MNKTIYKATVALSLASLMVGCTVGRNYTPPSLFGTDKTLLIDQADTAQSSIPIKLREPVEQWWNEFNDPVLSGLISQSLDENYDIRIAKARIEQARQLSVASDTQRLPSIDIGGSATRQRISQNSGTSSTNAGSFNLYQAGFDSTWELDLFGRVDEAIKSDQLELQARQADLRAVYVSVAAEVARYYIALRAAQYREKVAERNLSNQQASLDLTRKLVEGGRGTALDTARAETLLQLTKSTLPQLNAEISTSINRLAVLTGQLPAD